MDHPEYPPFLDLSFLWDTCLMLAKISVLKDLLNCRRKTPLIIGKLWAAISSRQKT